MPRPRQGLLPRFAFHSASIPCGRDLHSSPGGTCSSSFLTFPLYASPIREQWLTHQFVTRYHKYTIRFWIWNIDDPDVPSVRGFSDRYSRVIGTWTILACVAKNIINFAFADVMFVNMRLSCFRIYVVSNLHIDSFLCRIGIGRSLAAPLLPHHRTYGSRIRRFGGSSARAQFSTRLGSPKAAKYRQGSAITRAGLWLKRHGPWADLTVFQAKSALTPRFRSSR